MSAVNALHEISMEVATALEKCLDVEPGHVAAVPAVFFGVFFFFVWSFRLGLHPFPLHESFGT